MIIKKCPFCGGKANINKITEGPGFRIEFNLKCSVCKIKQTRSYELSMKINDNLETSFIKDEREECIKDWNKRFYGDQND